MPTKPITTEGIAAKSSMNGLKMDRSLDEAISDKQTAQRIPRGMAMTAANSVTETDPMIKGNIPKDGGSSVGYQS